MPKSFHEKRIIKGRPLIVRIITYKEPLVNDAKYIGLDVHQATVSATVLDSAGKLVMESIVETKAATILQFMHGLRGDLQVTFEEGTCAARLHGKRCEFVSLYCWFILEFLWPREIHRIWFVHPG